MPARPPETPKWTGTIWEEHERIAQLERENARSDEAARMVVLLFIFVGVLGAWLLLKGVCGW